MKLRVATLALAIGALIGSGVAASMNGAPSGTAPLLRLASSDPRFYRDPTPQEVACTAVCETNEKACAAACAPGDANAACVKECHSTYNQCDDKCIDWSK